MSGLPEHLLEPVVARVEVIVERARRARSTPPLGPETRSDLDRILTAAAGLRDKLHALTDGALPVDDPRVRHDLRTPLNHVLGYGEMLAQEAADEGRDDLHADLDAIVRAGREILDRLDDILAAARAAAARAPGAPRLHERAAVVAFDVPALAATELPDDLSAVPALLEALAECAGRHGLTFRRLHGARLLAASLDGGAARAARCALELLEVARASGWEGRAGLHVGPVVSGVLAGEPDGSDLWGAAPALALRVEAAGAEGCLTLAEAAWEALLAEPGAQASAVGALRGEGRAPVVLYRLQALP